MKHLAVVAFAIILLSPCISAAYYLDFNYEGYYHYDSILVEYYNGEYNCFHAGNVNEEGGWYFTVLPDIGESSNTMATVLLTATMDNWISFSSSNFDTVNFGYNTPETDMPLNQYFTISIGDTISGSVGSHCSYPYLIENPTPIDPTKTAFAFIEGNVRLYLTAEIVEVLPVPEPSFALPFFVCLGFCVFFNGRKFSKIPSR